MCTFTTPNMSLISQAMPEKSGVSKSYGTSGHPVEGENSVLKWPVLAEWLVRQSPTAEADVTKANNRVSTQNSSPGYLLHMMGDPFLQ